MSIRLYIILECLIMALSIKAQTGNTRAYVGGGYGTGIDVVDIANMTVVASIPDAGGYRMVLSLDGTKLYSTGGNSLIYITDTTADTLIKAFDPSILSITSNELEAIAISPDGSKVYVLDEMTTAIFVIDTSDDTVIFAGQLDTDEAENAVISPDGQFIYVNDNSYTSKFSTVTFECLGFVDTSFDGHGIAISSDGSKLYADFSPGILVIDSGTMTEIDTLSAGGYYLETSKDGSRVYGVNESNKLAVIDAGVDTLMDIVTLSFGSARGVTTNQTGEIILVPTSNGLIKLDAAELSEMGTISGRYQSVVILEPNGPVPVELTSFSASVIDNEVLLEWQTQTETNNFGFEVERLGTLNWETIGFVKGRGTTTQPQYYEFKDQLSDFASGVSTISYRLKQIDTDGSFEYSHMLAINLELPKAPQLLQNYPNPFNPSTKISYLIPNSGFVTVKVYSILGKEIQTLVSEFQEAGIYSINFDASELAGGIYFYNLKLGNKLMGTKKLLFLR